MMKHFVFAVAGIAVAAAVVALGLKTAHAGDMPIADMHCHLNPKSSPEDLLSWMDASGVKWCATGVLGSKFGARKIRLKFEEAMGDRYIPFGGQSDLNAIYVTSQDVSAQNDAENPKFKKIFSLLKKDFEEGRIMGIGELFLNTSTNKKKAKMRRKADINSPAMKALFALSNEHNGVISFHTEWDSDTVEQIDDLMSANPSARVILAHCGSNTGPEDVKTSLREVPQLLL
jgi:predicted urease superfamily metal-dependent hydrolase